MSAPCVPLITADGDSFDFAIRDMLDDPVLVLDGERRLLTWNPAASRVLDVEDLPRCADAVCLSSRLEAMAKLLAQAEGNFTLPLPAPDGERIYGVSLSGHQDPPSFVLVQMHDETSLNQAMRALHASEARFETISVAALDAIIMMGGDGRIRFWNPAASRLFGWSAKEAFGQDLHQLIAMPGAQSHGVKGKGEWPLSGTSPLFGRVWRMPARHKDGRLLQVDLSLSAARVEQGWVALGMLRDVTLQAAEQERLRIAEERWQFALEGGGDGVWDWNIAEDQVYFSHRCADMLGYGLDASLAGWAGFRDLVHPDDWQRVASQIRSHLAGETESYQCTFRMRSRCGDFCWIHSRGKLIARNAQGEPLRMVGTHRDVTETRLAEEVLQGQLAETQRLNARLAEAHTQLVQSEKMASLGQLSAGIAHEMNSPLGFVSGNLGSLERDVGSLLALLESYESLEKSLPEDWPGLREIRQAKQGCELTYLREDLPPLFAETRDGLERVTRIVRDLKRFSHAGVQQRQFTDLHQEIDSTLNILRNELKYGIEVVKDYGELPLVWCEPAQLNQVFMNLLVNAAHAVAGQGMITIRTRHLGGQVEVAISDNGCGIRPEHLARIFEPFFTTKPVGQGTGLGLSLAYGIVQKHQGRIEVDSQPGVGSTFRVILPVHGAESPDEGDV